MEGEQQVTIRPRLLLGFIISLLSVVAGFAVAYYTPYTWSGLIAGFAGIGLAAFFAWRLDTADGIK